MGQDLHNAWPGHTSGQGFHRGRRWPLARWMANLRNMGVGRGCYGLFCEAREAESAADGHAAPITRRTAQPADEVEIGCALERGAQGQTKAALGSSRRRLGNLAGMDRAVLQAGYRLASAGC